jgi:excisionase family DNA binding protein
MEKIEENKGSLVLNVWPDVGKMLNLSKPTVYSLVNQGVIPSIRFGRRVVVPKKALEELLASATREKANAQQKMGQALL